MPANNHSSRMCPDHRRNNGRNITGKLIVEKQEREEDMREDRREEKKKRIPMFTRGLLGISVLGFTRLLNC